MTHADLRQSLDNACTILAKLKDRKAKGERVDESIRAWCSVIRYLRKRLQEEKAS